MPTFFLSLPNQTLKTRTKLIHIPGAWPYPHTRQARPRNTGLLHLLVWILCDQALEWFQNSSKRYDYYVSLFLSFCISIFKFNSIFVVFLISSANIQLFHHVTLNCFPNQNNLFQIGFLTVFNSWQIVTGSFSSIFQLVTTYNRLISQSFPTGYNL